MNAQYVPGIWDSTYGHTYLGDKFADASVCITTAITEHLVLVSDLELRVRIGGGRATTFTEIRLSAQEMRELAELLETAADRVDELDHMRQQLLAEQGEVAV